MACSAISRMERSKIIHADSFLRAGGGDDAKTDH